MGPRQHEKACQDVACLSFNIADSAQADLEFLQLQTDLLSDIFNLANGDRPDRWMMEGVPGGGQGGPQRELRSCYITYVVRFPPKTKQKCDHRVHGDSEGHSGERPQRPP